MVALLKEHGAECRYREYTKESLAKVELKKVLELLGVGPRQVLRKRDAKKLGLAGDETDAQLIDLMVANPTLLERPIGVEAKRAILGRPLDNLLELL